MNSTKNQEIIDGIIAGDSAILKAFYKKNLPIVKRLILQYCGSTQDVEDIFQEALVLVYHKLRAGEVEFQTSIHSYFIGVCKNMMRNRNRKKRMIEYNEFIIDNAVDPSVSVTDIMMKEHRADLYHKHFKKLSDSSKQVLKLFFEGNSMREIAENMEYIEGYTRKKKCKIKERLLRMVQNDPLYEEVAVY